MQRLFEVYLERLSECVDEIDFRGAMADLAAGFDLPTFAYLALPLRHSDKPKLISNYPMGWTTHYLRNRYQEFDPVIMRARCDGCPFQWGSELGHIGSLKRQQQLFDEAAGFGICCGLTIPAVDSRGCVAAVTFAADEVHPAFLRAAARHQQALQLIATCFHIHVRRKLSGNRTVDGIVLTPREYECLQWAARGKSARDIGTILGITQRTATFHLDNVKSKLGVRTRAQAVARFSAHELFRH